MKPSLPRIASLLSLVVVVGVVVIALPACGESELDTAPCTPEDLGWEGLRKAMDVDYLELRNVKATREVGPDNVNVDGTEVEASAGVACKGAASPDACKAALAKTTTTEHAFGRCPSCLVLGRYLVMTKGDVVSKAATIDEITKLVGVIDAPAKAWFTAYRADYSVYCRAQTSSSSMWVREDEGGDGYEVRGTQLITDCPIQERDVVFVVRRDGTIAQRESRDMPVRNVCH